MFSTLSPFVKLCGVRIDSLTLSEAVDRALAPDAPHPSLIFTPNALMLQACRKNADLADLLNTATLSLPDGAGCLLAARRMGLSIPQRIAGIDFGYAVLERAARDGLGVCLLGGKPGVAERAAEHLREELPSLEIRLTHHGYFDPTGVENEKILTDIQNSGAEILFACLGFPRQEQWAVQCRRDLSRLRLTACLGGSLDVWAKDQRRAPQWVQDLGLEWAYRTLREPSRLVRIPALIDFSMGAMRKRL